MNIISSIYLAVAAILISQNNFTSAANLNTRDEVPKPVHFRYEARSVERYNHLEARRKRRKPQNFNGNSVNTGN
uniref:Secreted protein n=1 Tax=Phakopsora pachyrhizi TaxID=170000 RepID=A0A0S1MIB0_PHAPC